MKGDRAAIGVIVGTTRPGRFSDKAAAWLMSRATRREDLSFELLDLRDFPMPFFEDARAPAYKAPDNEHARRWGGRIDALDGFVFITAEYNRGPSAVLKNAIDYAYKEWCRKPAAFLGYGGLGGARAIEQLRMICVELQMAVLRNAVHIAGADFRSVAAGERPLDDLANLDDVAGRMLDELSWWAGVLKSARRSVAAQAGSQPSERAARPVQV